MRPDRGGMRSPFLKKGTGPPAQEMARRRFIGYAVGSIGAFMLAVIGVPLARFITFPATQKFPQSWSEVGPVSDFPVGEMKLAEIGPVYEQPMGQGALGKRAIYVLNRGDNQFVCYNVHCTHAGCPVHWVEGARSFFSPCHGGAFDRDGRVTAGPPPRPLDRHEVKVEDGILYVGAIYQVNDRLERVKLVE